MSCWMSCWSHPVSSVALAAALWLGPSGAGQATTFHTGEGSIIGSLCLGDSCTNLENFGTDVLRLKGTRLRLHFDDTSTLNDHARNDWRIVANDITSGGRNYLAFEDSSAGTMPFLVEAGARTNALYVENTGHVGIGTAQPEAELHVLDGEDPTLRLEQDGSKGFTPQTWDIVGNEANFFVRDWTNGAGIPLKIKPGVASNTIYVGTGGIGFGTDSPAAPLHLRRSDSTAKLLIEDTGSNFMTQIELIKQGTPRIRFDDARFDMAPASGADLPAEWDFGLDNNRDFILRNIETNRNVFKVLKTGDVVLTGALSQSSDRNAKTAILPVEGEEILTKLGVLSIAKWSYRDQTDVRHIGPMAQEFHALFGTGASDTTLSCLDTSGVALAAIKALLAQNQALSARLEALEQQVATP